MLPLFDPPAVKAPSQIDESATCSIRQFDRSDVLRVIQLKAGPRTVLRDGKLTGRTWRAVELTSGQWVREWDDGHRDALPPGLSSFYISDGLHYGTLVEVRS